MNADVKVTWNEEPCEGEAIVLAGDIGGTNANLALVARRDESFVLLLEVSAPSASLKGLESLVERTLLEGKAKLGELSLVIACISGAGPIEGNSCSLSNLPWDIDGDALAERFGFPFRVINDYEAISFGVPLLDLDDPEQVTQVPHSNGSLPEPEGDVRLVVGAGTGLGVNILVGDGDEARSLPSEGGHACFASFDGETNEIVSFLRRQGRATVEIEDLLSGRGIASLLDYYLEARNPQIDETLDEIVRADEYERPRLLSKYAKNHPVCRDVIRLFVKIYGRVAADMAAMLLPKRGLFLAGGIVGKNEGFFLEGSQFVYFFEQNSRSQVKKILRQIPVYVIRNYDISLYGAANAGWVKRAR